MSEGVVAAAPDWSLERAAAEMSTRGIRHLVVFEDGDVVGVLSMRDIVRVWTSARRHLRDDAGLNQACGGLDRLDGEDGAARTCCLRGRRK